MTEEEPHGGALGVLLLADARLPAGGHAHSATLEGAVRAGLRAHQVPGYLRARLRTVGRGEAAAAVLAARAARRTPVDYAPVQAALAARTPSAPLRQASAALGRGLTRVALRLRGGHPAVRALPTAAGAVPGLRALRPVVLGALGTALGAGEEQIARICLYEDVQTVASAALKLLPGDPLEAAAWVVGAGPELEAGVRAALATTRPQDVPAVCAPLVEQWAGEHEHATRRLFHA